MAELCELLVRGDPEPSRQWRGRRARGRSWPVPPRVLACRAIARVRSTARVAHGRRKPPGARSTAAVACPGDPGDVAPESSRGVRLESRRTRYPPCAARRRLAEPARGHGDGARRTRAALPRVASPASSDRFGPLRVGSDDQEVGVLTLGGAIQRAPRRGVGSPPPARLRRRPSRARARASGAARRAGAADGTSRMGERGRRSAGCRRCSPVARRGQRVATARVAVDADDDGLEHASSSWLLRPLLTPSHGSGEDAGACPQCSVCVRSPQLRGPIARSATPVPDDSACVKPLAMPARDGRRAGRMSTGWQYSAARSGSTAHVRRCTLVTADTLLWSRAAGALFARRRASRRRPSSRRPCAASGRSRRSRRARSRARTRPPRRGPPATGSLPAPGAATRSCSPVSGCAPLNTATTSL